MDTILELAARAPRAAVGYDHRALRHGVSLADFVDMTIALSSGARLGGGTGAGMVAGAALGAMGCNPITIVAGSVAGGVAGSVGGEALVNAFLNHK